MMKIEWIKVGGLMTAIDSETGEILNDRLDTLPADYDVTGTVDTVLTDLFGMSLNTAAEIKKETRGRKPKAVHNPYASLFANIQRKEDTSEAILVKNLGDLIYSASTTTSGNTRIPVKQLMNVMRLPELSTKGIQNLLGKRRILKGEKAPEERYCQDLLCASESLIKRIEVHQERGTIDLNKSTTFQFDADTEAYMRSQGVVNAMLCPVEFTEGDKRTIRALARAGNIEAINDYLQRVTEQSGRMMQRILGKPLSEDSKQAYDQLDAEFPYEPYEDDNGYVMRRKKLSFPITKEPSSVSWMFEVERQME